MSRCTLRTEVRSLPLWLLLLAPACRFEDGGVMLSADDVDPMFDAEPTTTDAPPDLDAEVVPDAEDEDVDTDGDGVLDDDDNCPAVPNTTQHNEDGDLHGNVCDNCPHRPNDDQTNADGDGVGELCDPRPGVPGDIMLLFDGFNGTELSSTWAVGTGADTWAVNGGVLYQIDTAREQKILYAAGFSFAVATVEVAFTPTAIPASTDVNDTQRVAGVVAAYVDAETGAGTGRVAHVGDIITSVDFPIWAEVGTVSETGGAGSNEFAYGSEAIQTGRYTLRARVANGRQSVAVTEPNGTTTIADDFDATGAGSIGLRTRNMAVGFEYVIAFGLAP